MPPVGRHEVGRRDPWPFAHRQGLDAKHAQVFQKNIALSALRQPQPGA